MQMDSDDCQPPIGHNSTPSQKITNVERSAATREKVLAATIRCLNDFGYEGTTVNKVAQLAAVSRGAAQHQFPSKLDLIIAAAELIVNNQSETRNAMWDSLFAGNESLNAIIDFSWSLQSHPDNIALLEIMMATRNNEELRIRFSPFFEHFIQLSHFGAEKITKAAGRERVDPELSNFLRLHFSVLRGLALDALVLTDKESIDSAIELLKSIESNLLKKFVGKNKDLG